ncbi:hypothetical protein SNOG_09549 [Parastagonospora nodorum SN15]|uniref:Uncharacterized protein n=1 Tax=Phaeosphaeria nodorum (strain SN15 / ATCC MYA-4574 / FGSC 10173) TaxID=321614 RepID=Q0UFB5_PHANO|nr:hypothetical protein SNOG_09549 [Parastagonospora nodorum SN15]EAT82814.2 hypothetical protein SNOG_09549 [Parastagonospora nodorum SN15]
MHFPRATLAASSLLLASSHAASISEHHVSARSNCSVALQHWPAPAAKALSTMITRNANQSNYAVFDMDNTSYRYDLEESLLPFLENRGVLTRQTLDPSLKLIPFKDTANFTESLYSYYNRLCEVDELVCYPWAAQIMVRPLAVGAENLPSNELMALNTSIPVQYYSDDEVVSSTVTPPKIFRGQTELYNALMDNGIAVEELVRMVASDPKYGYNVPPANVIGVTTMLRNKTSGALTTARKQIEDGTYDPAAFLADLEGHARTCTRPRTWFAGKVGRRC